MKALNTRHKKVVDYFNAFHRQHGRRPTYHEAMKAMGYASTSAVHFAIDRAEKLGIEVLGTPGNQGMDADVRALATCIKALESCSPSGRQANLNYLVSRFGQAPQQPRRKEP